MRWVDPRRGKGKRGSLRIIYYFFEEDEQIWFLTLYDKGRSHGRVARAEEGAQGGDRSRKAGSIEKTEGTEMKKRERDIFGELMEGVESMKRRREGKSMRWPRLYS